MSWWIFGRKRQGRRFLYSGGAGSFFWMIPFILLVSLVLLAMGHCFG